MKNRIKSELIEKLAREQKIARVQVQMGARLKNNNPQSPLNKLFERNVQNLRELTKKINSLKGLNTKNQNTVAPGSLLRLKRIENGRAETKHYFIVSSPRMTGIKVNIGKHEEVEIISEGSKSFQKIQGAKTGEKFILEDNISVEILKIS